MQLPHSVACMVTVYVYRVKASTVVCADRVWLGLHEALPAAALPGSTSARSLNCFPMLNSTKQKLDTVKAGLGMRMHRTTRPQEALWRGRSSSVTS
jgi:hypothetical protein